VLRYTNVKTTWDVETFQTVWQPATQDRVTAAVLLLKSQIARLLLLLVIYTVSSYC